MDVRDAERALVRRSVGWTFGFLLAAPLLVVGALVVHAVATGFPTTPRMIVVGILMLVGWCCIGIRAVQVSLQRPDS